MVNTCLLRALRKPITHVRFSDRHVNRPKFPQSSYMIFYTERVVAYKMARPSMAMTVNGVVYKIRFISFATY